MISHDEIWTKYQKVHLYISLQSDWIQGSVIAWCPTWGPLTEPLVEPSCVDLPLTLKLTPLGAFVFTSRLTASNELCTSFNKDRLARTSCGVVEILGQELQLTVLGDEASLLMSKENIHHSKPLQYQRMLELPSWWNFDTRDAVDTFMGGAGMICSRVWIKILNRGII